MELLALYIKKANKIHSKAIIFDERYSLSFKESSGSLDVSINYRENNVRQFYHIDQRLRILTLVGVNGTGKTTILECLASSFKHEYIVFYKFGNQILVEGHIESVKNSINTINDLELVQVPLKDKFSLVLDENNKTLSLYGFNEENRNSLFFSNLKNRSNKSDLGRTDGYYLSQTSFLGFKNDYEKMIYISNNLMNINRLIPRIELETFVLTLKKAEIKWNRVSLMSDDNTEVFEEDMDKLFHNINLNRLEYSYIGKSVPDKFKVKDYIYNQLIRGFMSTHYPSREQDSVYDHVIDVGNNGANPDEIAKILVDYANESYTTDYDYSDLTLLLSICEETLSDSDFTLGSTGASIKIKYHSSFVERFRKVLDIELGKHKDFRPSKIQEYLEKTNTIISSIRTNKAIYNDLLYIDFYQGSTGEESLIDLLISIVKTTEHDSYIEENNHNYVLLDEPDTFFNPELNRRLINEIVKLYQNTKSRYTIIMSTHSPFTLSDIPNTNILNLNNTERITKPTSVVQTFGCNISEISMRSFILDSNQGEFFIGFVNEILSKTSITSVEREKSVNNVNLIGDDFLREALLHKLEMIPEND